MTKIADWLEERLAASERRQQAKLERPWPAPLPEEGPQPEPEPWWSYVVLGLFVGVGDDYFKQWTGWRDWLVFLVILMPGVFLWQWYRMGALVAARNRWWPVVVAGVAVLLYYIGEP